MIVTELNEARDFPLFLWNDADTAINWIYGLK